jgi:nucleotide-binding universal stress UspA family protein
MKRILVPTDFSKPSEASLEFAVDLATLAKSEIFVVHMVKLPLLPETTFGVQPYPLDPVLLDQLEAKATQAFDILRKGFPPDLSIQFKPLHDYVVPGLRVYIHENKIDLVVMSTRGASGLREFMIGSTAEKIARFSPVPVIAIPQPTIFSGIKDIVFPNSLDLDQREVISRLKELQQICDARLHILFLNTPKHFHSDHQARQMLERFATHFSLENYTLNFRNHQFERGGILEFIHEINGDMLAMATHGRTGLSHFFTGSIAEDVLNRIDQPIWTFRIPK